MTFLTRARCWMLVLPALWLAGTDASALERREIVAPAGSVLFGARVAALPNGNIVVTDPGRSGGGAAYLYRPDGTLVSTMTGFTPDPSFDSINIAVLRNGNYVVLSDSWGGGLGSVTWGNRDTGVSGVVSAENSLVGERMLDEVGQDGIVPLSNGNYVVVSRLWNGTHDKAGAFTWADGNGGTHGIVSAANSLVGTHDHESTAFDVVALANGNYIVSIWGWVTPEGAEYAGSITWCPGTGGCTGSATAANSLVGTRYAEGQYQSVTPLANGSVVVAKPSWSTGDDRSTGAVMWFDGTQPITGHIDPAHALIGTLPGNYVGYPRVLALANGNYVVQSTDWESAGHTNLGAATWMDGTRRASGVVSPANSIVGSTDFDLLGREELPFRGAFALANGNYVITSYTWDNGAVVDAGAATWGNGSIGTSGVVSAANSLVGGSAGDEVGRMGVVALANGNYVVGNSSWHNGIHPVGAVTWGNGSFGIKGLVSTANSLVGANRVVPLGNGNYVVSNDFWDDGAALDVGAVRLANGTTGSVGGLSPANSLVGSEAQDHVGAVWALKDGTFAVTAPALDGGGIDSGGAIVRVEGRTAQAGPLAALPAITGSKANDGVGGGGVTPLPDGWFVATSPDWDNGNVIDAGAVSLLGPSTPPGVVDTGNSITGAVSGPNSSNGQEGLYFDVDVARRRLVVGRPKSNRVSLLTESDLVLRSSFEDDEMACPYSNPQCRDFQALYYQVPGRVAPAPRGPGKTKP